MSKLTKLESLRFRFQKGDVIAHQGNESEGIFLIETGSVRFEVDGVVVGRLIMLDSNPDYEFIGEVSALLGTPLKATAIAESDCSMVVIPVDRLEVVFRLAPSLGVKLAQSICKKLVAASDTVVELRKKEAA